jgi:hypothetical protein
MRTADTWDGNVVIGLRENDICSADRNKTYALARRKNTIEYAWLIPEDLVRLLAEFEVKPAQLAIITADNEMVTRRVNVHRRYPPNAGVEHFQELLLGQII